MIGGFALLAYPAEYGNSGVMTFLVNHNGVVYQKDLGGSTSALVTVKPRRRVKAVILPVSRPSLSRSRIVSVSIALR